MAELAVKIGKRIRELRTKAKLSQEQVAERADISEKHIGDIERGNVNVSIVILERIAKALDAGLEELLDCAHHAPRRALEEELASRLRTAKEEDVRLAYRILMSILR